MFSGLWMGDQTFVKVTPLQNSTDVLYDDKAFFLQELELTVQIVELPKTVRGCIQNIPVW
jgi:hypothetical protein